MGQFSKNLTKSLARQELGAGGISQEQATTNDGYEKVVALQSKLFAAGYALLRSEDPADQALLEELIQGSEAWREKVADVLLENGGAAASGLLRIITNPNTL